MYLIMEKLWVYDIADFIDPKTRGLKTHYYKLMVSLFKTEFSICLSVCLFLPFVFSVDPYILLVHVLRILQIQP